MKEIKNPKRPLVYYAVVAMLAVLLFNLLAVPAMANAAVKEVDYGTFMDMTEKGDIGKVEIESNQIIFTDKSGQSFYKTGLMDDPDRTERLYNRRADLPAPELRADMGAAYTYLRLDRRRDEQEDDERRAELPDVQHGRLEREGLCQVCRRHKV